MNKICLQQEINQYPHNCDSQFNTLSPEVGPEDQNKINKYQLNHSKHFALSITPSMTPSSSPNLSYQYSSQKEKQQITFCKSEQKKLIEDDDLIDLNNSADDEEDENDDECDEDELHCDEHNNKNTSNNKMKEHKSVSEFNEPTITTLQKERPNYQIIIKRTLEGDDFDDKLDLNKINHHDDDNQLDIQNVLTRPDSNPSSDQDLHTPGSKNWSKIRNVLKSIQLFSQYEVETISKPSDIAAHLNSCSLSCSPAQISSPIMTKQNSEKKGSETASQILKNIHKEAQQNAQREHIRLIDDFKYRKKFFEAIENGSQQDQQYIEEYLKDDPKKYLIVEESSERRMNKTDALGQTPMYCAAKNGNLEVLKILTKYKANNKLVTYLNNDQQASDTPLNVASRWGHVNVVEYLLNTYQWDHKDIKDSIKSTTNKEIKKLLNNKLK